VPFFGAILFLSSIRFTIWIKLCKIPIVLSSKRKAVCDISNENKVSEILELIRQCPTINKAFAPPLFFHNCHLQLVAFYIQCQWNAIFPPCQWISEYVTLPDGETIILDWANSIPSHNENDTTPILIINPGSCGTNRDIPGQTYIGPALRRGWNVCVFNRRGHGKNLLLPKFNFFGCASDMRYLIGTHIKSKRPNSLVFLIGISAGSRSLYGRTRAV